MTAVLLGLGSNILPVQHITAALEALHRDFGPLQVSAVYESEAIGFCGDHFLNLVVGFDCVAGLAELAENLRRLEIQHGRDTRAVKFSSRTLDIDILCYGDRCGEFLREPPLAPELGLRSVLLPRGEILENAFVLRPLAELVPGDCHPSTGLSFAEHWQQFQARYPERLGGLRRVDFQWQGRWISRAE